MKVVLPVAEAVAGNPIAVITVTSWQDAEGVAEGRNAVITIEHAWGIHQEAEALGQPWDSTSDAQSMSLLSQESH